MRTAGRLLPEFRRPVVDAIWLPGTFLTFLWVVGFRTLYIAWYWFNEYWGHDPDASASMVRAMTMVTLVHVGLFALLVADAVTLWRRVRERSATPWVAWALAFGLLAVAQAATTGIDLTHRLWVVKCDAAREIAERGRRHLAHGRLEEALASYEEAMRSYGHPDWRDEYLWIRLAHPDDRLRDVDRAMWWGAPSCILRKDARGLDVGGAWLAASGDFEKAVRVQGWALDAARREAVAPLALDAMTERLALYRAGKPFIGADPYPGTAAPRFR